MTTNERVKKVTEKELLQTRLEELCRLYNVSLDLIERTTTRDELVDRILEEYVLRFEEIPGTDLAEQRRPADLYEKEKIRSLLMFATQAVGLKEKADVYEQLRTSHQDLQRVTRELREANQKLEALNRHYLNMLGFVSHELRSPLISILGFAELLQEGMLGSLNAEQENAIGIITRVSRELIAMVRNYLDLAKIECGDLRLTQTPVDLLSEVVEPVAVEMQDQMARREMRLVKRPEGKPPRVEMVADRELLKIVFVNLLSNAIKYGKEGTEIILELCEESDQVHISITNEGTGVPENQLGKIFEKFTRAADPDTETARGAGLGLFNTKWIIEVHGGQIWAESKYGEWFRVRFVLPKKGVVVECEEPRTVAKNGTHAANQSEITPEPTPAVPSP